MPFAVGTAEVCEPVRLVEISTLLELLLVSRMGYLWYSGTGTRFPVWSELFVGCWSEHTTS